MDTSYRGIIGNAVATLLDAHLTNLEHYGIEVIATSPEKTGMIADRISQLFTLTKQRPADVAAPELEAAYQSWQEVEYFLETVQAHRIVSDPTTEIGHIYHHIRDWLNKATQQFVLPVTKVWELISPAQPDTIKALNHNEYEACWWTPVPRMDIEILRRTPGVDIIQDVYEPKTLAAGAAIRFRIQCVEKQ